MSTPRRTAPAATATVRQAAMCMCAAGHGCSSFAPGHAVHLIQARLTSATPSEWVDALVTEVDPAAGTVTLVTLAGDRVALWNGAGAAQRLAVGAPVAYHPRYHALADGAARYNVLTLT